MKSTTLLLIGTIIIFVLVAGAGIYAYVAGNNKAREVGPDLNAPLGTVTGTGTGTKAPASVKYFAVQKPNFVIRGENLGRVEVWATVGGGQHLLGAAKLQPAGAQPAGMGDTWLLPIAGRIGASSIYVLGYDKTGSVAARLDLPAAEVRGL
jgi:hypothetical protein